MLLDLGGVENQHRTNLDDGSGRDGLGGEYAPALRRVIDKSQSWDSFKSEAAVCGGHGVLHWSTEKRIQSVLYGGRLITYWRITRRLITCWLITYWAKTDVEMYIPLEGVLEMMADLASLFPPLAAWRQPSIR